MTTQQSLHGSMPPLSLGLARPLLILAVTLLIGGVVAPPLASAACNTFCLSNSDCCSGDHCVAGVCVADCPAGNVGDGCSAFCPCKSPNSCGLDFVCRAPCSYCEAAGICCGDEGQTSCAGFGGSGCNYDCKDGLRFKISSGTCEGFDSSCTYCQSTLGHCCGGLGDVSCAGTGEQASGASCNFECGPDLDLRDAVCKELCSYCSTGFGNCCGDVGQVSCAAFFPQPGMSDTCNNTCKDGACFDGGKATCQPCDSCDDDSYFTLGPCGKSYERTCNTATLQGCSACDDDYEFDLADTFVATSLCQPTWRKPTPNPPDTGFDFTFAVVGDLHVGDIPRSFCTPTSAWGVLTDMINTLDSSGLKWPMLTDGGNPVFDTEGQPIGAPLAVVMTGDMTHRGGDTADIVNFSDERKDFQDYWDERRDDDIENDGPSVNYTVYPGLGNHDRIVCGTKERTWDEHLVGFFSDADWWEDEVVCPIRASTKNFIMNDYMDFRMKGASGVSFDDTTKNYSWDWGPFHLIQGNTWVGDNDDLAWLKDDLANKVGSSGKPVILFQHYGWDDFSKEPEWWSDQERADLEAELAKYNVVAIFTGHRHQEDFIPASDSRGPGIDVYTTDDGGDDDACLDVARVEDCTSDADCDDSYSGTTDTCNDEGKCKFEDAENGVIKGDGGVTIVRLRDAGNCFASLDVVHFQWDGDAGDAGDMVALGKKTGSPTRSTLVPYCNLPPVAQCKSASVAADGSCVASASIDDGSFDPDGATPTCDQSPAGPYALGTTNVTLTCTDDAGLTDDCSADVTVTDQTKPVVTCPSPPTVECTGSEQATATFSATATDNCDANPTATCVPASGSSFSLGATSVDCSSTDTAGNTGTCAFDVTVEDTTKPSITCPANVSITSNPGQCSVDRSFTVTASDVCDPSPQIACVDQDAGAVSPTSHSYPVGTTTVTCTATDSSGLTEECSFTVTVNDPPIVNASPTSQSVQYSDVVDAVTVTATDCGDQDLTLTTGTIPAGLTLGAASCGDDGSGGTVCTWSITGAMDEPAGTYPVSLTASDGLLSSAAGSTTFIVLAEDAVVGFPDDNEISVQVVSEGGDSGAFSLRTTVRELVPDQPTDGSARAGDISRAVVTMSLVPIGPGSTVPGTCAPDGVSGTGYDAILTTTCSFDGVPVNTYAVTVMVIGGYYTGGGEDVFVVFDPSLGFTSGGFRFRWPGTDEHVNGGYTMKYNKKATKVQGSMLLIRHLPDDTTYRLKSNAIGGLSLGSESGFGWASFTGKCTYQEPGWPDPVGNYEFVAYVEDHATPGKDADRFWIEVKDRDRVVEPDLSMPDPATTNAVTILGGNIDVPHRGPR